MPITDNDLVAVVNTARDGATNIRVEVDWTDGQTGEVRGRFGVSFADADELRTFLDGQTFDDVVRAVLLQCINRTTGALRPTVFDGLKGKTFRVSQRVTQV